MLSRMMPARDVAIGTSMRLGGVDSFERRRRLEHDRQLIGNYRQSRLGVTMRPTAAARNTSAEMSASRQPTSPGGTKPVRGFVEPEGRHYSPYS